MSARCVPAADAPFEHAGQVLDDAVAAGTLPGAVLACGRDSRVERVSCHGWCEPATSPAENRQPMTVETRFDLASLTKILATTPAVLRLVAAGTLRLDTPVQDLLPGFTGPGKDQVKIYHLLTHTAGLPPGAPLASVPGGPPARMRALLAVELESPCGTRVRYSDLGFLLLGRIVEDATGLSFDQAVTELVTGPLGLHGLGFRPFPDPEAPPVRLVRPGELIAATELEPDGTARVGVVHDENARSLGGIAGHAGLFATAGEVGQALAIWSDSKSTFLPAELRRLAVQDQTAHLGGHRGLGWVCRGDPHDQLGRVGESTASSDPGSSRLVSGGPGWSDRAVTHTGFTGTSIALDPTSGSWVVLLTNDVHFGRNRGLINPLRRTIHEILAPGDPQQKITYGRTARLSTNQWATNAGSPGTSQGTTVLPPTERRNPRTVEIDVVSTVELLQMLNQEDQLVPQAVAAALPSLAAMVEGSLPRLRAGGHLHYFGSGTSGRLGALDAAELIPTYGVPAGFAIAHCAGGPEALQRPIEGAEDDAEAGRSEASELRSCDVAIGLSASGSTPYVAGALRKAREAGAFTGLITANPAAPLAELVDVHVALDTGPEAITGSTRMKAGSAQKMALSSFSTALMVRLGRSYSNLMVDVTATNDKLRARLFSILEQATGLERETCQAALTAADGSLKVALVSLLAGVDAPTARAALERTNDQVRQALDLLRGAARP